MLMIPICAWSKNGLVSTDNVRLLASLYICMLSLKCFEKMGNARKNSCLKIICGNHFLIATGHVKYCTLTTVRVGSECLFRNRVLTVLQLRNNNRDGMVQGTVKRLESPAGQGLGAEYGLLLGQVLWKRSKYSLCQETCTVITCWQLQDIFR
jgi:hypothetical protein